MNEKKIKDKCLKLRQDTFKSFIELGEAHLGGSFSLIEIIVVLFESILSNKDKFILSKSHASIPFLLLLRSYGLKPKLTTHLEIDPKNGIFCTTGSLGHGFPIVTGMALSRKLQKKNGKFYVLISDGECQEGTTWESMLIASKHNLNNLFLIIDYNKIQALSHLNDALPLENLQRKILAFNWNCVNITNGHSVNSIYKNLKYKFKNNRPTAFIVNTTKGKGIKQFENDPVWHAKKVKGDDILIGKKALKIL